MSYIKSRERKFESWWKKNHHKQAGQVWLCKSARRIAFAYNLHPSAFDDVRFICKRFFASKHMRLRKADAWKLYKLCNPLYQERLQRLQTTAEHLDAAKRVESKDGLQHPLWIGKPKQKKSLSEFLSGKPDNKDVPSAQDILDQLRNRRVVNGKLRYEDYVTGKNVYYPDSVAKTMLAQDILQKIDIVELVEQAVLFGIDNHDKYGEQTKDVITSAPLSLLFKILCDLNLAYTGDDE